MSERLRDWLPPEAAERPQVRGPLEAVVGEWSAHWVGRDGLRLADWARAPAGGPPRDAGWRDCGGFIEAQCSSRAAVHLACLALHARPDQTDLSDRDRALLSMLARRMVDDLAARLRATLGGDAARLEIGRDEPRLVGRISDGCDTLLSFAVPLPLLIRLARQSPPRPRAGRPAVAPRADAVTPTTVRLEAVLGAARLTLSEVRDLAVGDLLVLDRTLDDAIELAVGGAPVARGVLTEVDDQTALILQHTR